MKVEEAIKYLEQDFDDMNQPDLGIMGDISSLLYEASNIICLNCKEKSEEKCFKCKWYKSSKEWWERI